MPYLYIIKRENYDCSCDVPNPRESYYVMNYDLGTTWRCEKCGRVFVLVNLSVKDNLILGWSEVRY